jgi:hypothetical protein
LTGAARADEPPGTAMPAASGGSAKPDECAHCHARLGDPRLSAPVGLVRSSVHADAALSCAGCHGGDARLPTTRAHDGAGFVARPTPPEVVSLCGGCHADAAFIRDFDASLRIDQLALYRKSGHGRALAAGDETVATCTSCHGSHGIRKIDDAESPVRAEAVAATCGHCHEDPGLTEAHHLPATIVEDWRKGVHAEALAKGDRSAPTCNDCHGNHGARPPAVASIHRVCGACHAAEAEMFAASVHAGPYARLGLGECVECHSNHDIERPSVAMLGDAPDTACSRCHAAGSKGAVAAAALRAQLDGAVARVAEAEASVGALTRRGISAPDATALLAELHDASLRLPAAVHTMDTVKFAAAAGAVVKGAAEVAQLAATAAGRVEGRRRGYALSLVVIGLLIALLVLKLRRLERRRPAPGA